MLITIHRGTRQIGGSCIELSDGGGGRLILDVGRPLDSPANATGLLPASLDRSAPATVLIGHPHQDHYGLLAELPADWPVWTGEASAKLMGMTWGMNSSLPVPAFRSWHSRTGPFAEGSFTITPILTDHSAFDAYMLLIEVDGRRILYTGDFRLHGRKGALVARMMANPPPRLDALILEGTNLGTDKPVMREDELENNFVALMELTAGRVFVTWSAQNIDRTVTLYRAARRAGRPLVIDLYTADVLEQIAPGTGLPRPGWDGLTVVVTKAFGRLYKKKGRADFITRMVRLPAIAARNIPSRAVLMLRDSLIRDYNGAGVCPSPADAFAFSMWRGYEGDARYRPAFDWCEAGGATVTHLHTSGHASSSDLRAFAAAMRANRVIPVHGQSWDTEQAGFANLVRLADGESLELR